MEKILSNRLRRPVGRTIGSLIEEKEWLKALQVLQRHHAKRISKNTQQCGGVSLLIFAILHDAPVNFINAILDQEIYAMISKTEAEKLAGMSPLHIACACGSSFEVIYALTQHGRENGLLNSATLIDKCRRTPLHHLMHHLCFPKEMDGGRAIFGSGLISSGNSAASSSAAPSSFGSIPNRMSMSQDEFDACLKTLRYLVQVGPKAIFFRDINGHCPIDILHECKVLDHTGSTRTPADHTGSIRSPCWERADIGCVILRSEIVKYYRSQKAKAEMPSSKFADGVKKQASIDGTNSTTDGSSVKSGSILSGLSKLEVDSLSLGQMNLSVCSRKGKAIRERSGKVENEPATTFCIS
jgi:hypothetical protein